MKLKYFIFFIVFFSLPHAAWLPVKIGKTPEEIPLGMTNLIFLAAILLFALGMAAGNLKKNHFKSYTYFLYIVIFGTLVGLFTNYEGNHMDTLRLAKREITLLIMYFLPLAFIKNQRDFKIVCMICLFVHAIIGVEVMSSGVLGGSSFGDHKRGSGPFGAGGGVWGSDVAGSYLAQVIMFFFAILMTRGMSLWVKCISGLSVVIMLQAIFATYGRGAILGCGFGLLFFPLIKGLNVKITIITIIILCVSIIFLPESLKTRFTGTTSEEGELDAASQGRIFYYKVAFDIFKKHPLGVGTGQVRGAMQQSISGRYVDPHNGFLFTLCEYGIIGFVVFIWMIVSFLIYASRICRDENMPLVYRTYALGMGGLLGSLIACNMFYANFYKELVLGTLAIHFGMLAFINAECNDIKQERKDNEKVKILKKGS